MLGSLTEDFARLIIEDIPLIDVRAPIEFAKGAFPHAVNLPLLNDDEREQVGICYKQQGNEKAVQLGHQLICGDVKEARIKAWEDFINLHSDAMLYCFRGGERSRISQAWLEERGYKITRIKGGYKAFRHYLVEALEQMEGRFTPLLLGGRTGSGKTLLLYELKEMIDLEGWAKHRGSAFGGLIEPQPAQIDFENHLAFALIKRLHEGARHLIFEDEGKHVGRVYLPKKFHEGIAKAGLIILETPLLERVNITFDEYVIQAQKNYSQKYDDGLEAWAEMMLASINKIQRRLGSKRHREIVGQFEKALCLQKEQNDLRLHKVWIGVLLEEYYDPMYDYQLRKKENDVLFKGDKDAVLGFLHGMGLS